MSGSSKLQASLALLLWLVPRSFAHAEVNRKGEWPDPARERVTLSVAGSRSDALHQLADATGWSLVMQGVRPVEVDVKVKDQPAVQVLDLLLDDGHYVATRDGQMISIAPLTAAGQTPPPLIVGDPSPPSAARPKLGKDRVIAGRSITIGRDEVIGDLTVLGGSADVFGTISGDAAVMGGSIELHPGAHVYGDISAVAGSVEIEPGALVDGDVNSAGGSVDRGDDDRAQPRAEQRPHREAGFLTRLAHTFLDTTARTALLFAFGTVLLALLGPQMERLQSDFAARPMRAFALGFLGLVLALIGVCTLCVTIIGIPVAIVVALAAALGVYAGICAVFTSLGAALLRHHHSASPYVHLALGCALYWLTSSIPYIGKFVTLAAVLVGSGVLVSTRAAGLIKARGSAGIGLIAR